MTKTWQEEYPLNTFTGKTKEELIYFIDGIRKQDEEELIKMLPESTDESEQLYKQATINFIKHYYAKQHSNNN